MLLALTNLISTRPWHFAAAALWLLTLVMSYRAGFKAGVNSVEIPSAISANAQAVTTASTEVRCPITMVTVPAGSKPGTTYQTSTPVAAITSTTSTLTTSISLLPKDTQPSRPPTTSRGLNTLSVGWTHGQDPSALRSYSLTYERYLMYGISSSLTYRALDRSLAIGLGISF